MNRNVKSEWAKRGCLLAKRSCTLYYSILTITGKYWTELHDCWLRLKKIEEAYFCTHIDLAFTGNSEILDLYQSCRYYWRFLNILQFPANWFPPFHTSPFILKRGISECFNPGANCEKINLKTNFKICKSVQSFDPGSKYTIFFERALRSWLVGIPHRAYKSSR